MKPVDQTRLYDPSNQLPPGNCFQACIASVLEVPLFSIPDEKTDWEPGKNPRDSWRMFWLRFRAWLQSSRLGYVEVRVDAAADMSTMVNVPFIATGPSPRGPIDHCVVMQYERKDDRTIVPVMLHDPHPSRDGLRGSFETMGLFVPAAFEPPGSGEKQGDDQHF